MLQIEYSRTNIPGTHLPTPGEWTAELAGGYVCILCIIYLEPGWELNNYLGKLYCVSVV